MNFVNNTKERKSHERECPDVGISPLFFFIFIFLHSLLAAYVVLIPNL